MTVGIPIKGPTVNTGGLTSQQARLAIDYAGAETDARVAVFAMSLAVEQATEAAKRAEDALRVATDAKRSFSQAVPDWAKRVTEERR